MYRPDGMAAYLAEHGWDCSDVDILNVKLVGETLQWHDLSCAVRWDQIHADMRKGEYAAIAMGTPCETASRARTGPPGPRPVRSPEHIYGLPKALLTEAEHKQVQQGTYFALKSSETALLAIELGIPGMIENPDPSGNPVSLFNLPEWQSLMQHSAVKVIDFHQCPLGAETRKPTRVIYWLVDLSGLTGQCDHAPQQWHYTDAKGASRLHWGPHPPLVDRIREDGSYATKAAGAWPAGMNQIIARHMAATRPPLPPLPYLPYPPQAQS